MQSRAPQSIAKPTRRILHSEERSSDADRQPDDDQDKLVMPEFQPTGAVRTRAAEHDVINGLIRVAEKRQSRPNQYKKASILRFWRICFPFLNKT